MMSTTYDQRKLQSIMFRIAEMVKQMKVQLAPRMPWLFCGLLVATGIVLTVLMFSPHLMSLTPLGTLLGSPMPSETQVMQVGELPVDVLEISEITFLSGEQGDGSGGVPKLPNPRNAFAPPLAPQGQGGTWTKRADMPTARARFSVSMVDGKIYAIGGLLGAWAFTATVEEYDPAADKWTKKADMPTSRFGLSTSVVNGRIYAIGGWNGRFFSTVEEYDPATDTWMKKADMPTARGFLSTSVVSGNIYAIGGENNASGALSTVEEYDPATDTWTKKADMPTGRFDPATSMVNGEIYAIGGGDVAAVGLSVMEEYDPVTDTWTKKADMPTSRFSLSTSIVNGKIYAIGGATILNGVKSYFSTVEEYDPATDTWVKKADMLTTRAYLSTSVVKGKIYAIGGSRQWPVPLATVEEYTPEGWPFSVSPQGKKKITWGRIKTEP